MTSEIVGRQGELERLRAFLDATADGPRALVLEGEAGIGKSTLWLAAVEEARRRGLRVLVSRPAEAERGLSFAGLADLLEEVVDDVLPELAPPRRRALEVALLLAEARSEADPRALGAAVRSALELLAREEPIAVAIDDTQWLDSSSAAALSFALRRQRGAVVALLAHRLGEPAGRPEPERALPPDAVERVRLGPLSVGAVQLLLQARLDRVFARPTLLRIHEASGGNPFYALELARALPPDVDPTRPLPVPDTLEGLLSARLAGLPRPTRHALVLASALGGRSWKALLEAGVDEQHLEPALAANVVAWSDGSLRFTHPLLASVVYAGLSAGERRHTHQLLAEVVDDPLERARHLALATEGTDDGVAAVLEEAAALAARRGASAAAAELWEHALRLTPATAGEDEHRRTIAAGRAHMAAGEVARARTLGLALAGRSLQGPARAEALLFLGELESGPLQERIARRREALREPALPAELRALIHQRLAIELRFFEGREAAAEHARLAVELARGLADDSLLAGALAALAMLEFQAGAPGARERAEEACRLAEASGDVEQQTATSFCLAHVLVWSFELAEARRRLESVHRRWSERDERVGAQALWYLALVELWAGRLAAAGTAAERTREVSALYGRDEAVDPQSSFPIALVLAHRGELDAAGTAAEGALRLSDSFGALLPGLPAVLGLVAAWGGKAGEAVRHFEGAEQAATEAGWVEPGLAWWRADHVETLLELGRREDALALLAPWEAEAARLERAWVLAHAARCRGLAAAAAGDVDEALAVLEKAAGRHEAVGDPLGRGRALLGLGTVSRRARRKRAAREAIEEAIAIFEACGAEGWAGRARAELGSIGGRRREEGLTAAERRIAALVAEGRTNREVAAALFVGERTVETHLSHIYAKLGVRSRTELARVFQATPSLSD